MNQTYRILYKANEDQIAYWEAWIDHGNVVHVVSSRDMALKPSPLSYKCEAIEGVSGEGMAVKKITEMTAAKVAQGYNHYLEDAKDAVLAATSVPKTMKCIAAAKFNVDRVDWNTAFLQPVTKGYPVVVKNGKVYSSSGNELDLPHIELAVKQSGLANYTLEAVLSIAGYTVYEINAMVYRDSHGAEQLNLYIHDIFMGAPFATRAIELNSKYVGGKESTHIRLADTFVVHSTKRLVEVQESLAIKGHREFYLYHGDTGYTPNKKSSNKVLLSGNWKSSLLKEGSRS